MTVNNNNNNNATIATTSANSNGTQMQTTKNTLKASDFINMMVTQLQNQDPLNPTSNSDLLNQMSQIGQLQSSTDLSSSLKTITLQSDIASASNMIGKMVQGQDTDGTSLSGLVTAVHVENSQVSLDLDNGKSVSLSNITDVAPVTATTTSATPTGSTTSTGHA